MPSDDYMDRDERDDIMDMDDELDLVDEADGQDRDAGQEADGDDGDTATFASLGLPEEILEAVTDMGFRDPHRRSRPLRSRRSC